MASIRSRALAIAITGAAVMFWSGMAGSASATDFCTSLTDPGCPAGAVAINPDSNPATPADIDAAMVANGKDGQADRLFIGAGLHLDPGGDGFFPEDISATDDLEVIGAGRESTVLSTTSSGNIYLLNLNGISNRKVTMRDLALRIPDSFPDLGGFGAALQSNRDDFVRVDFVSRNPVSASHQGSSAVGNAIGGGTFRDIRVFGNAGGGFGTAFTTGPWSEGDRLVIEDSEFRDFAYGVTNFSSFPGLPLEVSGTRFASAFGTVLSAYNADGAADTTSVIENSIIEAGELFPVDVITRSGTTAGTTLEFRNNTMLNMGGAPAAFRVRTSAPGDANLRVSDSIVFGFGKGWEAEAPTSGSLGDANVSVRYSNLENPGELLGDGTIDTSVGNISATPLFSDLTDYRLSPDSPSIDAGDPAAGGLAVDFDGAARPLDGDGDGVRVRDQGAYEAPEIPTCATDPALCPAPPPGDTVAPKITGVKLKAPPKRTALLRFRLSEDAATKVVFKPTPKGKGKKRRKVVKLSRAGKAGVNKVKVKKGKLKPGKYSLTIVATDAAGNRSKLVKKVRVKAERP